MLNACCPGTVRTDNMIEFWRFYFGNYFTNFQDYISSVAARASDSRHCVQKERLQLVCDVVSNPWWEAHNYLYKLDRIDQYSAYAGFHFICWQLSRSCGNKGQNRSYLEREDRNAQNLPLSLPRRAFVHTATILGFKSLRLLFFENLRLAWAVFVTLWARQEFILSGISYHDIRNASKKVEHRDSGNIWDKNHSEKNP